MTYYDPTTNLSVLIKQPWEDTVYDIPFEQVMRSGDTIDRVESVEFVKIGNVEGSEDINIAGSPAHNDTYVQPRISGGTNGENYKITGRVTTAGGDSREVDVMMYVRD